MDQFPTHWPGWLKHHLPWLGFGLMWLLGGTVAHIKAWQKAGIKMTWKQHMAGMFIRLVMAMFVSMIVYFMHIGFGWDNIMMSFIIAGIASVFASDFIDFMWFVGKEKVRRALGLPPEYGAPTRREGE